MVDCSFCGKEDLNEEPQDDRWDHLICNDCGDDICPDCAKKCHQCHNHYCPFCVETCPTCSKIICNNCADAHVNNSCELKKLKYPKVV